MRPLVALVVAAAPAAHAEARVSAGAAVSERGEALAADAELHASVVSAEVRYDDGLTALVGYAPRLVRRIASEPRWKDACVEAMRSGDRGCWVSSVEQVSEPRDTLDGWLGVAIGARRSGARTSAVAAAQIFPASTRSAEVELALTALVAGPVETYVHHARFAPGWYARARYERWHVFAGGEAGMTGFAARTSSGTLRAETYALATLGVTWVL